MKKANAQPPAPLGRPPDQPLESWKEIAAYLKRDVRTVQRWEQREGLPVHRHLHQRLGTVYAYKSELDAWWKDRQSRLEHPAKAVPARRGLGWVAAAAAILVAGLGLAVWRYHSRSQAEGRKSAPGRSQMIARRVWSGPDLDRIGAVSHDGKYLVYMNKTTEYLTVRELATGRERELVRESYASHTGEAATPIFSPDGKQIAFAWFNRDFSWELRLIGFDGTGSRVLFRKPEVAVVQVAEWSPDGAHILSSFLLANGTHQIVLIRVNDGTVRLLKDLGGSLPSSLRFSKDGEYIAYDFSPGEGSTNRNVLLLAVDSAPVGEVPVVVHPSDDYLLGWAPDGKGIVFASDRTGTLDVWAVQVRGGKPGGVPEMIKKDCGHLWPIGFTKSGHFYYGVQTGMADVYVAGLDPSTGALLAPPAPAGPRFAGSNRSPTWSRDGSQLALASQPIGMRRPLPRVIIHPTEGGEERQLQPMLRDVEQLAWSPDGRSILVTGADRKNLPGVFVIDAQTGGVTVIARAKEAGEQFHEPLWSPDGKTIFYKVRLWGVEPARLLVKHLTTGLEKELLASVYRFDLSPEGRQLAFSTFDKAGEYIRVVPVAGGQSREVFRQPRGQGRIYSVAWSRDGRHLLFARKGQLWRISAEGAEPEKLPIQMESLRDLRPHPDGRRIAFTAGTGKGEVWVIENLLPPLD